MGSDTSAEAYRQAWRELQGAARALDQAASLIDGAHAVLDRYCAARDQTNWDQHFPWRVRELRQASALCREVAANVHGSAPEGES